MSCVKIKTHRMPSPFGWFVIQLHARIWLVDNLISGFAPNGTPHLAQLPLAVWDLRFRILIRTGIGTSELCSGADPFRRSVPNAIPKSWPNFHWTGAVQDLFQICNPNTFQYWDIGKLCSGADLFTFYIYAFSTQFNPRRLLFYQLSVTLGPVSHADLFSGSAPNAT